MENFDVSLVITYKEMTVHACGPTCQQQGHELRHFISRMQPLQQLILG